MESDKRAMTHTSPDRESKRLMLCEAMRPNRQVKATFSTAITDTKAPTLPGDTAQTATQAVTFNH